MRRLERTAIGVALTLGAAVGMAGAAEPIVFKSIQGALDKVDAKLRAVTMKTSEGRNVGWRLPEAVVSEVSRHKPGDAMWVIYRSLGASGGDSAVTAVGFPGPEPKPVFVNATGGQVLLRTGPMSAGACAPGPDPTAGTTDHLLRTGEVLELEVDAPCWCCANRGEQCGLANRSHDERGTGRIVLARCFP
jgi:hypothetical protein